MKVALLTSGNSELSRSLIGSLKGRSDVELIVVHTRRLASDSWRDRVKTQAYIALRKRFLNEEHPGVPMPIEPPNAVYSPDINSQITHQSLLKFRPDLIIISGTKKVEKRLLEAANLAVNLHHGFLPTYRGVSSLDWVVLEGNFNYFAVSLHKAVVALDAGPLLAGCYVTPYYREPLFLFRRRVYLSGLGLIDDFLNQFAESSIESVEPSAQTGDRIFKHADKAINHHEMVTTKFADMNLERYTFWQRYRSYVQRNWDTHSGQMSQSPIKKYVLKKIIKRISRKSLAPGLYILTYHDICKDSVAKSCAANKAPMIYASASNFKAHLDYFDCEFRCTTLGHGMELLHDGALEQDACVVLTFDDGFREVAQHLDAMNRQGLTPTFFVCGDPLLTNKPLGIHQDYLVQKYVSENGSDVVELRNEFSIALRHGLDDGSRFHRFLKANYLDVVEIQRLLDEGRISELGSHTRSHQDLAKITHSERVTEIVDNHIQLQGVLGNDLRYFSFPFGKLDRRSVSAESLAQEITPYVFECNGGINQKCGIPGGIVRIGIGNHSVDELDKLLKLQWTR